MQHLHLSCCDIDNVAVARIAEAISAAPDVSHTIESVNLGWNDILGDSIHSLVQSLRPLSGLVKAGQPRTLQHLSSPRCSST